MKSRKEHLKTFIYNESSAASLAIASEIAALIKIRQLEQKKCVLGLATGSSPIGVYKELVRMHQKEGLSFENVVTFNLDEYYPMDNGALQSYVRFMNEHLFSLVNIKKENIHIPDGTIALDHIDKYCHEYEQKIDTYGGVDLQLLGIGRTGHIGFNEPGSYKNSETRLISLDMITRKDAASDFFGEEYVPNKAITMGVGSILRSKKIIMMAWGEGKANIIKKAVEGEVTDKIPSTFLQEHPNCDVYLDNASASELTRIKTPWLVGSCDWKKDDLVRKAVVWLSLQLGKSILKLTQVDYMEHGMSDLLTLYDSAYRVNIKIFNELQHTITGWPGGKPNADDANRPERSKPFPKKAVIFSPHPDDDVISMGGTFIRLVDQGHDVHVAYQTSGNIAVFDDDAIRFIDFVNDHNQALGLQGDESIELYRKITKQINAKTPGDIDSKELLQIKGLIRRGEAKAACRYVGIPDENVNFLDMPFYETGKVKKKPISQADVDIIKKLLSKIQPQQIYAAGDLSDPHGTHRVCLDAIFKALEQLKNEKWMKECYVWLYRGAWHEWEIEKIEMAVPLSPDELIKKRRAIFKHQSQKDDAMFPGNDEREFWMRAEDRNHATAAKYNQLGLADYEAMEAFVRYKVK